jgi:adenine-specific DNA methylase
MLDYSKSFIETQFPVSKVSKESYKERKAGSSQTLTSLGKWWGRKPLILVRAAILGIMMPVSENPIKDKEIFLKILTMDESGLWYRKSKTIAPRDIYFHLNKVEVERYFEPLENESTPKYLKDFSKETKDYLQKLVFNRLSYDEKLNYCERPENVNFTNKNEWTEINNHLETTANSIQELIHQLGEKRFERIPKIGDCFSGGGSIPFEAARLGATAYASDLNPVASLLSWASLNLLNEKMHNSNHVVNFQKKVFSEVDKQITQWGIEHNDNGDRADAFLYCTESFCPECGYKVPLSPTWIIGLKTNTVAILKDNDKNGFDIDVVMNASDAQKEESNSKITLTDGFMYCPHCTNKTPISSLRKDFKDGNGLTISGLRAWKVTDFSPQEDDIYQERLYAIRYMGKNGRYYVTPSEKELEHENKVHKLLNERFSHWQNRGYLPSSLIEPGDKTDEPIRTRGWTYWHHLFNPRMLLLHGLFMSKIFEYGQSKEDFVAASLGMNAICDWDSKLCRWINDDNHTNAQTFYNQAFNTMFNYSHRPLSGLSSIWGIDFPNKFSNLDVLECKVADARTISDSCDVWITDPPYADAVNYHELTEFFLAWDKSIIERAFPEWYSDSKRILAVKGVGQSFNESMIEIYQNLANHMPDNGRQVVMFTHQDVKVWSELAMILWSAGLHVVSAWNVATETESGGLKSGNYVKGTVLLTLKKQTSNEMAFQDELYDEIKHEVKNIIDSMRDLDDKDDPDFTDADYLLASYASTLKVLTAYKKIEGIDVTYWLAQPRDSKEENPIEMLINKAVRIAYDYLIPEGFDKSHWADLKPEERFFVRGLELEMNQSHKISAYQELARGFGVTDYKEMFAEFKANAVRLKTPSEYKMTFLNNEGFGSTLTRHILVAIYETSQTQSTVEGRNYLRTVFNKGNEYWYKKPLMQEILSFIAKLEFVDHMPHWKEHAYSAKILKEALKNEGM